MKVMLSSYWSPKHQQTSYAVSVKGTSRKLFMSADDLVDLREQITQVLESN